MSGTNPSGTIRRRLIYRGHVQGVGFRYTTASIARRHSVTGFVRNLPDGTVELVVEGQGAAVDAVLADVAAAMQGHIASVDESEPTSGEIFRTFEIRR